MSVFSIFKNKIEGHIEIYNHQEFLELDDYIVDKFGEVETVLQENVSWDIKVDLYIIKPTKDRNFYTVVTNGMGAHKMSIDCDDDVNEYTNAELVLYMPPTWNYKSELHSDTWPLFLLQNLSRVPINNLTWLGSGHTISNGESYSDDVKYNNALLLYTSDKDGNPTGLTLSSGKYINFYMIVPLYEEECQFKIEKGLSELLNLFEKENFKLPPIIRKKRKNYCKK